MNPTITKKDKVIFWVSTVLFVLFEAGGALFFNTPGARDAIAHFGFPQYFGVELALGKIIGGIILILPMIPRFLKEWAYVGFGISLISAFIAIYVVDGPVMTWMPILVLAVAAVSYKYYRKIYYA